MNGINKLALARNLTARVQTASVGLENGSAPILHEVSDMTAELLRWWFQQDYVDMRSYNFHEGQKQAILNTIYAHEVLGVKTLAELYTAVAPEVMLEDARASQTIAAEKNAYPKYCMKMATGTGKTWVLQTLMIWQILNASRDRDSPRFTRNFLVVAPGLIVYDRLLDAFMGKERSGKRDFENSDIKKYQELFIPETYRDEVFRYVQGAVCPKEEIGRKVTSGGIIAISNWHILSEEGEELEAEEVTAPGIDKNPAAVVADLLPLTPGTSQGNDLNQLNRKFERGGILNYLRELPSLMVFNDEAHHIHDFKKEGEVNEVEWQKSLNLIAEPKGQRFVQVDFSATPYNQLGTGKNITLTYFPHIIVDFDLKTAMRLGLVKSIVLDKRKEIGALSDEELEFKAYRDEDGNPALSEGQRIMLRAGLAKLKKLEIEFTAVDSTRHPKMLVMCEDTSVTPLVNVFLRDEGLADDEILRVDSNRKGDMPKDDWAILREKLFDMDAHKNPRVVISVLMLREGFDVNNICVIVPLRSSQARILLEQTIGRGLRLMWRGNEYDDLKRDNRHLIKEGKSPESMIDILSIVEHPAFQQFYEELMKEGLAGEIDDDSDGTSSTGDLISVPLRDGYEAYDFHLPFILQEREETIHMQPMDVTALDPFSGFTLAQLKSIIGKGEKFISEDVQTSTRFGDYRVDGGVMTATGYNDYVARLVRRIGDLLSQPLTKSAKVYANQGQFPHMQVNKPQLAAWVDGYIRQRIFEKAFDPMAEENWRILLVDTVTEHIIKVLARKLLEVEEKRTDGDAEVAYRSLSEVERIAVRDAFSVPITKCIYSRLPFPSRSGGLEKAFIEMADRDGVVEALCKINEQKHDFVRLRYIKEDGLPAYYSPDFVVRTKTTVYLAETKAQEQLAHPNVRRKRRAALSWCERINNLPPEQRMGREWRYVLLGEAIFYEWRDKGAMMPEMLDFAALRGADYLVQGKLAV
jgi:type III restriction enzyme